MKNIMNIKEKDINDKENFFKTPDFSLTSYLITKHFKVFYVEKGIDNKFTFYFEVNSNLQKEIEQFWQQSATVEPIAFYNSLRTLKSLIRNYGNK